MYKTNITKEFKQKGFYNKEKSSIISTKKSTEGEVFNVIEALEKIGGQGLEVEVSVVQKDSFDAVEEE